MDAKLLLKESFDRDGFVLVRQFLKGPDLQLLQQNLDRYIHEVLPSLPKTAAFFQDPNRPETLKQMQHMSDPFFVDYIQDPRWNELARTILGEEVVPQPCEWFNKPPGTQHPTPPHQDNYYFCWRPPNVCTAWLALDTVDESNGCLRYVKGSHQHGLRPHARTGVLGFSQAIVDYSDDDVALEQVMTLQPGDLVAHHGQTIHRADPNSCSRPRRAFAIVFRGVSCERDEEAYARYTSAMNSQHGEFGINP